MQIILDTVEIVLVGAAYENPGEDYVNAAWDSSKATGTMPVASLSANVLLLGLKYCRHLCGSDFN